MVLLNDALVTESKPYSWRTQSTRWQFWPIITSTDSNTNLNTALNDSISYCRWKLDLIWAQTEFSNQGAAGKSDDFHYSIRLIRQHPLWTN